jgi:predicted esterase
MDEGLASHEVPSLGPLVARPAEVPGSSFLSVGLHHLEITSGRRGLLYIPSTLDRTKPASLIVISHGAGGRAEQALSLLQRHADQLGFVVLAPQSQGRTWDIIVDVLGPDVKFIDQALAYVFERLAVDPKRTALAGFSDGASYALTLGLMNGDLFSHILAFSPGFAAPKEHQDHPRIFISHEH